MRPDHRVALAVHQRLQDADVRLVDLGLVLVGDLGGLLVRALHDPDAAAGGGQAAGVGLGAEEVRLDHAAGLREVPAQLLVDGEHRVEGGVVLGVQRDGGADGRGGLDDRADVGERELVAALQRLAEHRQLDRHLGLLAESQARQVLDEFEVGVTRGVGLLDGGDVLAHHVERELQALLREVHDDRDDLVDRLAGDEPVHHGLGHRGGRDDSAHLVAARSGEDHGTQHGAPPTGGRSRHTVRAGVGGGHKENSSKTTVKPKDRFDPLPSTAVTHPCPRSHTSV